MSRFNCYFVDDNNTALPPYYFWSGFEDDDKPNCFVIRARGLSYKEMMDGINNCVRNGILPTAQIIDITTFDCRPYKSYKHCKVIDIEDEYVYFQYEYECNDYSKILEPLKYNGVKNLINEVIEGEN